jgi:glyceraldehyde 3-phosphate dehydrogenase
VSDGSVVDLVATLQRDVTKAEINDAMRAAASKPPLRGILEYSEEPLVSSDVLGNPHSSVFDALSTTVLGKRMVKVVSWYDNEFAYAKRTAELIERLV